MRSCATVWHRELICSPIARLAHAKHRAVGPTGTRPCCPVGQPESKRMVATKAITPLQVAIGGAGLVAAIAWVDAMLKSRKPELTYTSTKFNDTVLSCCPTIQSTYKCTPFLTNGHAETILVAKLRKPPGVDYRREVILAKDGGAVAVDWEHFDDQGKDLPADAPILILFPGLTGGSCDAYVQHAVLQARHAGIRAAVFNSRGTANSPVTTPQFYSASFTDDTQEVVAHVRKRYPNSTLFAAGWSLGANILVNYLGEQGSDTPIEAAVSMCNPFNLTISNRHINEGFNKIYNRNLAASLKRIFAKHELVWKGVDGPARPDLVPKCNTIREFDEAITIHSFGWPNVDAYYAGSSSAKHIPNVAIPLLCIQAANDPISPAEAIPYQAIAANSNCVLAVTPSGGHLGWASGPGAPFNHPWTDVAVVEWLSAVHAEIMKRKNSAQSKDENDSDGSSGGSSGGSESLTEKHIAVNAAMQQRVTVTADSKISNGATGMNCSAAAHVRRPGAATMPLVQQQQQQGKQHSSSSVESILRMEQLGWGRSQPQLQQQQHNKPADQQPVVRDSWAAAAHDSSTSNSTGGTLVQGTDVVLKVSMPQQQEQRGIGVLWLWLQQAIGLAQQHHGYAQAELKLQQKQQRQADWLAALQLLCWSF